MGPAARPDRCWEILFSPPIKKCDISVGDRVNFGDLRRGLRELGRPTDSARALILLLKEHAAQHDPGCDQQPPLESAGPPRDLLESA